MRNAVKAVIDAKTCAIKLYAVNMNEPITAAWNAIYPGPAHPAQPVVDLPALRICATRRTYFNDQAQAYASVHMHTPSVFFQGADLFNIAQESVNGTNQATTAYYVEVDASRHQHPAVRAASDIFSGSERRWHRGEQHDRVARG